MLESQYVVGYQLEAAVGDRVWVIIDKPENLPAIIQHARQRFPGCKLLTRPRGSAVKDYVALKDTPDETQNVIQPQPQQRGSARRTGTGRVPDSLNQKGDSTWPDACDAKRATTGSKASARRSTKSSTGRKQPKLR